jgi:hypothetical protein
MAQLDSRSDRELEEALKKGELGPRKSAFAKEILRRREEAKGGSKFIWVSSILAAVTLALAAIKRFGGRL